MKLLNTYTLEIKKSKFIAYYYQIDTIEEVKELLENLKKGISVVLEIETEGAKKVMREYPDCVSIFITPPNMDELEKRLRGRKTECEEAILKRLEAVKRELKEAKNYKYTIVNNKVESAFEELQEIYEKEKTS